MTIKDSNGNEWTSFREAARSIGVYHQAMMRALNQGLPYRSRKGVAFWSEDMGTKMKDMGEADDYKLPDGITHDDLEEFMQFKKVEDLPFERYDFTLKNAREGRKYAVALFSDAHIEETIRPDSVLGLNEYNLGIARKRVESYFNHLALCLRADRVDDLIFASLGDTISGYIHDELAQTNGLSPLEAIYEAQNLIINGLRFLVENTELNSIKFIGICGNHSRSTKRVQHSNGYRMSYEWLMYKNIEKICGMLGLPIDFAIPESELAVVNAMDGRRFIFMHGFQIKSSGNSTVCGIYPALNRLTMKYDRTFHQDRVYLGHFHSCISIPNAVVNGSIVGYSAFSLSNGFSFERPAQMYQLFDAEVGELLTRKIYCD